MIPDGLAINMATDAQMVELGLMCAQASFDVAQVLAVGGLREHQLA